MPFDRPHSRRALFRWAAIASASRVLAGCIPDGRLKRPFHMEPMARPDGLRTGSIESVGLNRTSVEAAYRRVFDEDELHNIRSLLVARHGVLVAEAYIADAADIDRRGALMSATKSVTSTLAGIAVERGELSSLDVTVEELFPGKTADTQKQGIRLRDALTMRAGIDFSNDDFSLEMDYGDANDSVGDILEKPLSSTPGTVFHYTDASAHLAGAMVQRATGMPLDAYAQRHLLGPAGVSDFAWLRHRDGLCYGAYGLFLTPRDFLRFGLAALRAARGAPNPVVSRAWMDVATAFQVKPDFGGDFRYGLLWWVAPDGRAFTAAGHGGQFAYSVPELDLEVVVTADPNSNEETVSVSIGAVRDLVDTITTGARPE